MEISVNKSTVCESIRKEIFIHIGPPKTATTSLQECIFPNISEIFYIGWPKEYAASNFYKFLYSDGIYYDEMTRIKAVNEILLLCKTTKSIIVFSKEHLTHQLFDVSIILRRIKDLFGLVNIIVGTRNQMSWIESSYIWELKGYRKPYSGGLPVSNINKYINTLYGSGIKNRFNNRGRVADFGNIVRYADKLFQKKFVHVIVMEELVSDTNLYIDNLMRIFDIPPNQQYYDLAKQKKNERISNVLLAYLKFQANFIPIIALRIMDKIYPNYHLKLFEGGKRVHLKSEISLESIDKIRDMYSSGNNYLIKSRNIDLEKYGYFI